MYVPNYRFKINKSKTNITKRKIISAGDFNTLISIISTKSRQIISKDIGGLNNTINQVDLMNIYKISYQTIAKYTFLSNTHGIFTKIKYILHHKTSLNKFKRIKIMHHVFCDDNGIK